MNIEDPHGVDEFLPAATTEQQFKEELEFKVVVLSFLVQQYGNWIEQIATQFDIRRQKTGMGPSKQEMEQLGVFRHQMSLCQKLAVRANKRYERLSQIQEVRKGNA